MPKAIGGVVVDHADGLHHGVHRCWADESKPCFFEGFAQGFGGFGLGGELSEGLVVVGDRGVIDEGPDERAQGGARFVKIEDGASVVDRRFDLELVADNGWIVHQALEVGIGEPGNLFGIEVLEEFSIPGSFFEDGLPAQPGLGALEGEHLEDVVLAMVGHAPLGVMIFDLDRRSGPLASAGRLGHCAGSVI